MRFFEIDLFGVYIAPISVMMVGAWLVQIVLSRVASYFGFFRYVWHAGLFELALYLIVLSTIVLLVAR